MWLLWVKSDKNGLGATARDPKSLRILLPHCTMILPCQKWLVCIKNNSFVVKWLSGLVTKGCRFKSLLLKAPTNACALLLICFSDQCSSGQKEIWNFGFGEWVKMPLETSILLLCSFQCWLFALLHRCCRSCRLSTVSSSRASTSWTRSTPIWRSWLLRWDRATHLLLQDQQLIRALCSPALPRHLRLMLDMWWRAPGSKLTQA